MKKWYPFLVAVLGVVIGAVAVLAYDDYKLKHKLLSAKYDDWGKLNLILSTAESQYVDTIDRKAVTDAAVVAALRALDPHSTYLEPQELRDSESDLSGEFEGVGIVFNVPEDTAVVMEVIAGGPSEKVGVQVGDRIIKVDDKVIAGTGCPQDSMVRLMRGPAGTKVTLSIKRQSENIPFNITRGKIPTYSVDAAFMTDDTTAYLKLSKFSRTTGEEVQKALADLSGKGMKKLIFDLRGNSGGFLDQSLIVSDLFLSEGCDIVYMMGRNREKETVTADGQGPYQDLKMVLLVDDGTASSAEIFSGAMQDNGRAPLVGRRTFGKGLVQEPFFFTDGSGIRLTVARFYTPSGRCIQKPYTDDYDYEVWQRYSTGEMVSADSMKLAKGGILPDIFVPIDTTKVSSFHMECNRKSTMIRFSSAFFDAHREELAGISDYAALTNYLDRSGVEGEFLKFARQQDGLKPEPGQWPDKYMSIQLRALVSRYTKLSNSAFYRISLGVDDVFKKAIEL